MEDKKEEIEDILIRFLQNYCESQYVMIDSGVLEDTTQEIFNLF